MPWAIAIILLLVWSLGLSTHYTLGGYLHVLLVAAILVVVGRILWGRRAKRIGGQQAR